MPERSEQPERPRVEPEIIPPDRRWAGSGWPQANWRYQGGATHRIYVGRIGPLGIAVLILLGIAVAAVLLFAVLGALLIWIPFLVLLVIAGALFRPWRR